MSSKGFIGLGVMGSAMAVHISNKYSHLIVYNRTPNKANSWVKVNGGQAVSNAAEVGELCEQVFLCVGNDEDVKEVVSCFDFALSRGRGANIRDLVILPTNQSL